MYNIRKGWPSQGAVDEVLTADTGQTITEGMIVTVTDGKASVANFTGAASKNDPITAFIMGHEDVRKTFTGIMSQCVIEVDAEYYQAGTYNSGDYLTAKEGKFALANNEKVIGRVLTFKDGILRLMMYESH